VKQALRVVIDKNGAQETIFQPTGLMMQFGIMKARDQAASDFQICQRLDINFSTFSRWRTKYGSYFTDWLEEFIEMQMGDHSALLEAKGMEMALQDGNFQYWREMARTKGVIKDDVKPASITINTDFTAIIAAAGGDLNAARARILQETRGLAQPGAAVVAPPAPQREQASPAARASDVQGGSLEVDNSLGEDRGHPEQGEPIPAVPRRHAPSSNYVVLDEGEISSNPEE